MAILAALLSQEPAPSVHAGPLAPVLAGLLHKDPTGRFSSDQAAQALTALTHQPPPHSDAHPNQGSNPVTHPRPSAGKDPGSDPATRRQGGGTKGPVSSQVPVSTATVAARTAADTEWRSDRRRFEATQAAAAKWRRVGRSSLLLAGLGTVIGVPVTIVLTHDAVPVPIATLTGGIGIVYSVAFSPDGKTLATGGDNGTVRWWDVASRETTATLTGHTGTIRGMAYSPDGKTLATSSFDGTMRLWDVADGTTTATITGYSSAITSVAFSPDSKTLAAGSDDGTVRLWSTR